MYYMASPIRGGVMGILDADRYTKKLGKVAQLFIIKEALTKFAG